mmetsp:Transcript_1022/g.2046  ORF Transcript_1022/g.2046 Transcript_1022/m.2046 type:complete len:83 (+) Transcript_1022:763-1011(+)
MRGVPSSITKGELARKRRGIDRYIPPCDGIGLSCDEPPAVAISFDDDDGAVADMASSDGMVGGTDSATTGTPNMEARIALTT